MGLKLLFVMGIYLIMIFEVYILIWFLIRSFGLLKGKTDFTISKAIPLGIVIYTIITVFLELNTAEDFYGYIPYDERKFKATQMFVFANLSTPLFPLLAWLKHLKIKSLTTSEKKSS